MLSELCVFTGRTLLSFSRWALTTIWGCPNFCSRTPRTSLYIRPEYAKSAIAMLALPVTSVLSFVSVLSSERVDCESIELRKWPIFSCRSNGLPSYLKKFYSGNGFFLFHAKTSAKSRMDIDCVSRMTWIGTGWCTHATAGSEKNGWWSDEPKSDAMDYCNGTCSCAGVT